VLSAQLRACVAPGVQLVLSMRSRAKQAVVLSMRSRAKQAVVLSMRSRAKQVVALSRRSRQAGGLAIGFEHQRRSTVGTAGPPPATSLCPRGGNKRTPRPRQITE
jgi:hypothetical protein